MGPDLMLGISGDPLESHHRDQPSRESQPSGSCAVTQSSPWSLGNLLHSLNGVHTFSWRFADSTIYKRLCYMSLFAK